MPHTRFMKHIILINKLIEIKLLDSLLRWSSFHADFSLWILDRQAYEYYKVYIKAVKHKEFLYEITSSCVDKVSRYCIQISNLS